MDAPRRGLSLRIRHVWLAASASVFPLPAMAADQLKFGPAPSWAVPPAIPTPTSEGDQTSPFSVLLSDQQIKVEAGSVSTFVTSAFKLQTPEGLQIGNLSFRGTPPVRPSQCIRSRFTATAR